MFGRRKDEEDPFAALKDGGTYQSSPITVPDIDVGLGGDARAGQTGGLGAGSPAAPASAAAASAGAAPASAGAAPVSAAAARAAPSLPRSSPVAGPTLSAPQGSGLGSAFTYGGISRTRRSGLGAFTVVRVVFVMIVIAAIAIPLLSIGKTVHSVSIPSFNFGSTAPSPGTPGHARTAHLSYLTPGGARAGIAHLKRVVPGASVVLFRLDAKSLSATAVGRHGAAKEVYFGPTGTFVTSAPATGERPVPLSQVRPAVVEKLVAEMRSRFHVPARRIDYMVISSPQGLPAQWIVFSKAPSHPGYAATLSGGGLHRL